MSTRSPLTVLALFLALPAAGFDAEALREPKVVEILTVDPDGDLRETKVWIVVAGGSAFVRTDRSRWLANIRRGSEVTLRVGGLASPVQVRERDALEVRSRVETAFLAKYGFVQRIMSRFRLREPSVLELEEVER